MSEAFLHYIWQHQYFEKSNLLTTDHHTITVLKTGFHNLDSGPDFKEAKVEIDNIEWYGQVEIHILSSDWYLHNHQIDKAYDNTILHVVWQDDRPVKRTDGTSVPTLELKNKIYLSLLKKHDLLLNNPGRIPCEAYNSEVSTFTKLSTLDTVLVERLKTKSEEVALLNKQNNFDWEETCYQLLAKAMGFKKNSNSLFELARLVPYRIIKKHSNSLNQIEALLFGVSGMLEKVDEYSKNLFKEYQFLKKKYQLNIELNLTQWKFLRLRPANFPTIRIAQLAAIVNANSGLMSKILEKDTKQLVSLFKKDVSPYWVEHYSFGKKSSLKRVRIGDESASNICINVVAPILTAYSKHIDDISFQDKAVNLLASLKAENNVITRKMVKAGFENTSAHDSQALIELFNNYCSGRHCLDCKVGTEIIAP